MTRQQSNQEIDQVFKTETRVIQIYHREYELPMIQGDRLQQRQKDIRQRCQLIREGKPTFLGLIRKPLTVDESIETLDGLITDYKSFVHVIEGQKASYTQFFSDLIDEIKDITTEKFNRIAALETKRVRLARQTRQDLNLQQTYQNQREQLLKSAQLVGCASLLMLKKLALIQRALTSLTEDQEIQRQVLDEMLGHFNVYTETHQLQKEISEIQQEAADMVDTAIDFEEYVGKYLGSLQEMINQVVKLDQKLSIALEEIKDLTNIILGESGSYSLGSHEESSMQIINWFTQSSLKQGRLTNALRDAENEALSTIEMDFQLLLADTESDSVVETLANIQTHLESVFTTHIGQISSAKRSFISPDLAAISLRQQGQSAQLSDEDLGSDIGKEIPLDEEDCSNPNPSAELVDEKPELVNEKLEDETGIPETSPSESCDPSTTSLQTQRQMVQDFNEYLDHDIRIEMASIPGGSFLMGSPETEPGRDKYEGPQHTVTLSPFFMGRYPVTQAQWRAVAAWPQVNRSLKPAPSPCQGDYLPVEDISWDEAVEFCDRLSHHTGRTYRLPSEAEWEYACRAGTTTPFNVGETLTPDLANYYESYPDCQRNRSRTTDVGSFFPNPFQLSDMHGNVKEWCLDHWHPNYGGAPTDGSAWLYRDDSAVRVVRGGAWLDNPASCRSASRDISQRDRPSLSTGFRVVCLASTSPQQPTQSTECLTAPKSLELAKSEHEEKIAPPAESRASSSDQSTADCQQQIVEGFTEDLGHVVSMEMTPVPGGRFLMGSPKTEPGHDKSEYPQHAVTVSPFFMGRYPITQGQWRAVAAWPQINHPLEPTPSYFEGNWLPVEGISWDEAMEFCQRISRQTGKIYRLPSEAEWEYACRAGTTTPFSVGKTITSKLVNYNGNYLCGIHHAKTTNVNSDPSVYGPKTTRVGRFSPNQFQLSDMHGNVWEWCLDHWHPNYDGAPTDGSPWLSRNKAAARILRGGSWFDYSRDCRSARRIRYSSANKDFNVGLRIVCVI